MLEIIGIILILVGVNAAIANFRNGEDSDDPGFGIALGIMFLIISASVYGGLWSGYSQKIILYEESGEVIAIYADVTNAMTQNNAVSFIDSEGNQRTIGYSGGWVDIKEIR